MLVLNVDLDPLTPNKIADPGIIRLINSRGRDRVELAEAAKPNKISAPGTDFRIQRIFFPQFFFHFR